MTVRVHNLDNSNGFSFPAKSVFVLKINGQKVALQGGDLLSNITLVMKKGERRTGILTFRLDESQKISIRQWKLKPQISSLRLALTPPRPIPVFTKAILLRRIPSLRN